MKQDILDSAAAYLKHATRVKMACGQLLRALEQSTSNMALELAEQAAQPNKQSERRFLVGLASYPCTAHMQAIESSSFVDGEGEGLEKLASIIAEEMNELLIVDKTIGGLHDTYSDLKNP